MKALLSIKPEYVDKIFSGEKGYEYRKAIFKQDVKTVVVYSTQPVGKIVGEFDIDTILVDRPEVIWEQTKNHSGVNEHFYRQYFSGRNKGYAIKIGERTLYQEPLDPYKEFESFTAPQSFKYI